MVSGPRGPVHPQRAALRSLSLSVHSGQGPQPPCYGPEARAAPSPCVMSGSKDGAGLVPTSWGRQRESRQDQARREGGRMGCPREPQGWGGEGCARGGTEIDRNSRERHAEKEGGREREGRKPVTST